MASSPSVDETLRPVGQTAPCLINTIRTADRRFQTQNERNPYTDPPKGLNADFDSTRQLPPAPCSHIWMTQRKWLGLDPNSANDGPKASRLICFCQRCHWHLDLYMTYSLQPCPKEGFPLHHFAGFTRYEDGKEAYTAKCSECLSDLRIIYRKPVLCDRDIFLLTDAQMLRRRSEAAGAILVDYGREPPERPTKPTEAIDILMTYLSHSLDADKRERGIPKHNRKFMLSLGEDCGQLLVERLSFTERETYFCLPQPELTESKHAAAWGPLRATIDDALEELRAVRQEFVDVPSIANVYQLQPAATSFDDDVHELLSATHYKDDPSLQDGRNRPGPHNRDWYIGLGCLPEFSDSLLSFAFYWQAASDRSNYSYYYDCMKNITAIRQGDPLDVHSELSKLSAGMSQNVHKKVARLRDRFEVQSAVSDKLASTTIHSRNQSAQPSQSIINAEAVSDSTLPKSTSDIVADRTLKRDIKQDSSGWYMSPVAEKMPGIIQLGTFDILKPTEQLSTIDVKGPLNARAAKMETVESGVSHNDSGSFQAKEVFLNETEKILEGNTHRPNIDASPGTPAPTDTTFKAVQARLSDFFVGDGREGAQFDDANILQISRLLHLIDPRWSTIPRTYIVLRSIGCLDFISTFIDAGFSDYWFPVTEKSLPQSLHPSQRVKFVNAQNLVMTKSIDLEKGESGQHCWFRRGESLPFETMGLLGSGSFGQVDKIFSFISFQEYARKRVSRSAVLRGRKAEDVKQFIIEIAVLKRVKHHHIVQLIGSYTDPKYVALIMSPVADMDLHDYLVEFNAGRCAELRTFFGCLARALEFLHESHIRHKDIKPKNILIHQGNVLFTDFGLSFDFSDAEGSTTVSTVNGLTPRYCAPEVVLQEPRNTSSDIWSLGIVFLEMVAVLKGRSVQSMYEFLETNGSRQPYIRTNPAGYLALVAELQNAGGKVDNVALSWVQDMLEIQGSQRPTAAALVTSITSAGCGERMTAFCGICCMTEDDLSDEDDEFEQLQRRVEAGFRF